MRRSKMLLLSLAACLVVGVVASSVLAQETPRKVGSWRDTCARCKKLHEAKPAATTCNQFVFDSTKSYDPNNKKISVKWDFGDGTTSTEPVVKHVYEKSGEYTVVLTVTNNAGTTCDTDVTTRKVVVNTPPRANFAAPEGACVNQDVTFDASSTTGNLANGTYNWDFGDGTKATGVTVVHAYKNHGTYKVRLMVDDNAKTSCSTDSIAKAIMVNSPPVAVAGRNRQICLSGNEAMMMSFDGSGSHDPNGKALTYEWDFGDGSTGTGMRVSHEYAKPGTYKVTLSVSNGGMSTCNMASDSINVSIFKGPSVKAGEDSSVCVGESVSFDGSGISGSGSDLKYHWDFGDGATAEEAKTTHSYAKGGTYRAVLSVNDGTGSRCSVASAAKEVTVGAPPAAKLAAVGAACTGENVLFDASGSNGNGGSLKYTWDFGDGTVQRGGSQVSHAYEKAGQYTAKVDVQRVSGSRCAPVETPCSIDSASTTIKVSSRPVAKILPCNACCVGKEVVFDGSMSSGDNLSYVWDFGDGSKGEGVKTTHTYTKRGTYRAMLTVNDNSGSKCSKSMDSATFNILEKPTSVIQVR